MTKWEHNRYTIAKAGHEALYNRRRKYHDLTDEKIFH